MQELQISSRGRGERLQRSSYKIATGYCNDYGNFPNYEATRSDSTQRSSYPSLFRRFDWTHNGGRYRSRSRSSYRSSRHGKAFRSSKSRSKSSGWPTGCSTCGGPGNSSARGLHSWAQSVELLRLDSVW